MSKEKLRSVIQLFQYDEEKATKATNMSRVTKPTKKKKFRTEKSKKPQISGADLDYSTLEDLPPMISDNLTILFVGFNPGVESSRKQHHYAHHSNLFWKLFNALDVLLKVLQVRDMKLEDHEILTETIFQSGRSFAKPEHDQDLVQFGVGFTDLVLRCTKTAQELTKQEKIDNVPRLFSEFTKLHAEHVIVIGKGIWEFIVKYIDPTYKLTKENFHWGLQTGQLVAKIHRHCDSEPKIHVFPNTSGLVALMKFPEKLALWMDLAASI